jgi:Flp pilus assembly protein TadD
MRYALRFGLAILVLTMGALATFERISTMSLATAPADAPLPVVTAEDRAAEQAATARPMPASEYARLATADKAWRQQHARQYTLNELRQRAAGNRTPREAMQDRVFIAVKKGQHQQAIAELERWVRDHPRDQESLLSLARLLGEAGRTDDAVARYRQLLALSSGKE